MRTLIELTRLDAFTQKGKHKGRVKAVLFHPREPRAVGFTIARSPFLWLIERRDRYVAFDRAAVVSDDDRTVLRIVAGRDAWDAAAEKRLGFSWDDTVEWLGMPVETESGQRIASVRDALIDEKSGKLGGLGFTEGITSDLLIGVRDIGSSDVIGFSGSSVKVSDRVLKVERDGGAAAAAGRGAAKAKAAVGDATDKLAYSAGRAAAVVKSSKAGRKVGGWLKAIKDEVADAMGDPDE